MTFTEFKKSMKKFGKYYEYAGFRTSSKGYKERHYQEVTADGKTTVGEPITADRFEDIVERYQIVRKLSSFHCSPVVDLADVPDFDPEDVPF